MIQFDLRIFFADGLKPPPAAFDGTIPGHDLFSMGLFTFCSFLGDKLKLEKLGFYARISGRFTSNFKGSNL